MNLATLQGDFRIWLVYEDPDAAARIGAGAQAGLGVYQNNYRSQLVACLEEAFERVHSWLGDQAFRAAAATHIDHVPPIGWTLDAYAPGFVSTLASLYPDDPEVAELGWLDRALAQAFVGPDVEPVMLDALSDFDWDSAVLGFTPTLAIATFQTNAAAIWCALSAGETPPPIETLSEPSAVLVWRQDFTPCFRTIDNIEHSMIEQARLGRTFGDLCSTLTDTIGANDGIVTAGTLLARWFADGIAVSAIAS